MIFMTDSVRLGDAKEEYGAAAKIDKRNEFPNEYFISMNCGEGGKISEKTTNELKDRE